MSDAYDSGRFVAQVTRILVNPSENPYLALKDLTVQIVISVERPSFVYQLYALWPLSTIELLINLAVLAIYLSKDRSNIYLFRKISSKLGTFILPRFPVAWLISAIIPLIIFQPYMKESVGNGANEPGSVRRGANAYGLLLSACVWLGTWLTVWTLSISTSITTISTGSTPTSKLRPFLHPKFTNIHFIGIMIAHIVLSVVFITTTTLHIGRTLDMWQEVVDQLTEKAEEWTPDVTIGEVTRFVQGTVLPQLELAYESYKQILPKQRVAWGIQLGFNIYGFLFSTFALGHQIYVLKKHQVAEMKNRRARFWKNITAMGFILILSGTYMSLSAIYVFTELLVTKHGIEIAILSSTWSFTTLGLLATLIFSVNVLTPKSTPFSHEESNFNAFQTVKSTKSSKASNRPTPISSIGADGQAVPVVRVDVDIVRVEMVELEKEESQKGDGSLREGNESYEEGPR